MRRIDASKHKRVLDVGRKDVQDEEHFYLPAQPRLGSKTLNQILRIRTLNTGMLNDKHETRLNAARKRMYAKAKNSYK